MSVYNNAIAYLKNKYGSKFSGYTASFERRILVAGSVRKIRILISNAEVSDKIFSIDSSNLRRTATDEDLKIFLLVQQYHLGIQAKQELAIAMSHTTN